MGDTELTSQRQEYAEALAVALDQITGSLAREPRVHKAILFGSYVQGRRDLLTDLDILIVMDSPLDFVTRTAEMYRSLSCAVDVDLLVYTPEELERNRNQGFIRQVLEKGTILYERHPS